VIRADRNKRNEEATYCMPVGVVFFHSFTVHASDFLKLTIFIVVAHGARRPTPGCEER